MTSLSCLCKRKERREKKMKVMFSLRIQILGGEFPLAINKRMFYEKIEVLRTTLDLKKGFIMHFPTNCTYAK